MSFRMCHQPDASSPGRRRPYSISQLGRCMRSAGITAGFYAPAESNFCKAGRDREFRKPNRSIHLKRAEERRRSCVINFARAPQDIYYTTYVSVVCHSMFADRLGLGGEMARSSSAARKLETPVCELIFKSDAGYIMCEVMHRVSQSRSIRTGHCHAQ